MLECERVSHLCQVTLHHQAKIKIPVAQDWQVFREPTGGFPGRNTEQQCDRGKPVAHSQARKRQRTRFICLRTPLWGDRSIRDFFFYLTPATDSPCKRFIRCQRLRHHGEKIG
jgi:hypothetical protein